MEENSRFYLDSQLDNMLQDVFKTDITVLTKSEQLTSDTVIPFGQSLHIDLYGVSTALCDDLSFCYQLLDDLTHFLQMHKQSPPFIFRSPEDQFPEKAGLSGWVPLIESGISIHTLTVTGFVSIDVYTCGDLDKQKTIQFLCDRLQTHSYESQHLIRGTKYYGKCV